MRILVIRLSSIGDIILTTPILKQLRKKFPEAIIDYLVMDTFYESISENPHINNLFVFQKAKYKGIKGIKKFSTIINDNNYDVIIDLHVKLRSVLISKFLKTKKILRYKKRSMLTSLGVRLRLIPYHSKQTIVESYFSAFKKDEIFRKIQFENEFLEFYYTKNDEINIIKKIPFMHSKKYIVIAPGASKKTKMWLVDYWVELIILLFKKYTLDFYIVGSKSELTLQQNILEKLHEKSKNNKDLLDKIHIMGGKLSLKETSVLMKHAFFCITNDSGPFHIARAVHSKVFVIFGPTDPYQFTYNENTILLYNNQKCSACSFYGDKKCPKKHFKCMKNIIPERVADKIFTTIHQII